MQGKRLIRHLNLIAAVIILLAAAIFTRGEVSMSGNEAGRFAVIQAVGEQRVFFIEKTVFRTVDKVIRDGHIYSDKPPALAWMLGILWRIPHSLMDFTFEEDYTWSVWMVNFFLGGGVNLLLYFWIFNALRRFRGRIALKWLFALAASLNGWLFAYSVVLNNHTPAALAALGCAIALHKFRRSPTAAAALMAGGAAGLTGAIELPPGAFFGIAATIGIFLTAPPALRLRHTLACIAAGLTVIGGALWLNFYAYGTWVPLYLAGDSATYSLPRSGLTGYCKYAFDNLFWTRGLFSYQPFLLLAIPGIWHFRRRLKTEWAAIIAAAATIIFYLVATNEYGGAAYGFRYLIAVVPILWIPAAAWLIEVDRRTFFSAKPGNAFRRRAAAVSVAVMLLWGFITGLAGSYAPFCIAYEGYRSPPGHFTRVIQSTFWGNTLCIAYDLAPDSILTEKLIKHYGEDPSSRHLYYSFFSLKRLDMLQRMWMRSGGASPQP